MIRSLVISTCFVLFIINCSADVEYEEHGHHHHHHHHHDHDGHDHHDHESHKDLFTGGDFDGNDEQQRDKLRSIAEKIDTNKDGKISRDEMRVFVEQRLKDQHLREANDFISTLDPSNSNRISFETYVRDNFGDLDVTQLEKANKYDSESRETRRTYTTDKAKWSYLDKDGDRTLSHEEFRKFLRPEDDEGLRKIEIESIIKEYDENNDGRISKDEYLKMTEAETGQKEQLGSELDTNKDGYGDFDEFARYYLPTTLTMTEEETEHLFHDCDVDKNGYCTTDEIVRAYSSFAGSQVTDFGADLEAKEEL